MAKPPKPRWYEIRRAHNRKPATYRCPLCGQQLPALIEHMLLVPEGDATRRRHAHTACVMAARRRGALPSRGEWHTAQRAGSGDRRRRPGGPVARLRALLRRS